MGKKTILIVDDNIEYCKSLCEVFRASGNYHVMAAYSGSAAIEAYSKHSPRILLLDLIMPHTDGFSVLDAIDAKNERNTTSVIMMSPALNDLLILAMLKHGAKYILAKPMLPNLVYKRLNDLFKGDGISDAALRELYLAKLNEPHSDDMRDRIIKRYLNALGVSPHLQGYEFLQLCIAYCVEHNGSNINMKTQVYPYAASICSKSIACIERNIRTAIECAWNRGDIEVQHKTFGNTINEGKGRPTNKEFISLIAIRTIAHLRMRK